MRITHELTQSENAEMNGVLKIESGASTTWYPANFEFIKREDGDLAWIKMKQDVFVEMICYFDTICVKLIETSLNAQFKQFEHTSFRVIKN